MPGTPYAGTCLLLSSGGGSAELVAVTQRHSMPQFSVCSDGLQPNEPEQNARAGLILGKEASRHGLDGEDGCSNFAVGALAGCQ
jgi:hypothetical protein